MTRRAVVHRISMRRPDDVEGLDAAIRSGAVEVGAIVAVFGKTEGNGCVNDWTRALAARAIGDLIGRHLGPTASPAPCLVMSGGTEGALAPHLTVFEVRDDAGPTEAAALAIGRAHTEDLAPEHLGRLDQVRAVATGVLRAMHDAGIDDPAAVHLVQVKCPLLTSERIVEAQSRGVACATRDTLKSMGLSRAASALGIAVALGETELAGLGEAAIGADWGLFSGRASASAGIELLGHEIVVLGTGRGWSGPLRVDHAVMRDAIDIEPVRAAFSRLGLPSAGQLSADQRHRLVALIAKTEAASSGLVRGYRHTMLIDSDISPTRHARGFTAGVLAGLVGHAELYVSGGAEHQGPDGGGPVAIIVDAAA